MANIIQINQYKNRKEMKAMFDKLIEELKDNKKNNHQYSLSEINEIAVDILTQLGYYPKNSSIPIVKIAREFGFRTYKENLTKGLSGDIYINGNTENEYGNDKIILVNKKDELYHQRFVVAHELAHYLFDFLGDDKYSDKTIKFSDTYHKNKHETPSELRANLFAAAILMPESLFIDQYNRAKSIDRNRMFVIMYLSRFFETTIESIEKRIVEVLR